MGNSLISGAHIRPWELGALQDRQLVFLVGAPRSGTTWLQLLLSRSPAVVTAQETDLFNKFLRAMLEEQNRYRRTGEPYGLTELLNEEEFRSWLRTSSGFIFTKIAQAKPSATVVLEKTPNHVQNWREIVDVWPEAHFIHIIRDPRAVVASLRFAAKKWGEANWGGTSRISTICQRWISDVSEGRQIPSMTHRYQEVTYEELTSDNSGVLMRLLNGLGLQVSLDECQGYTEECRIDNLRAGKLENAPFDLPRHSKYRVRIGTVDSWRKKLSKWEIAVIEHMARPLMSELGYRPTNGSGEMIPALVDMHFGIKDVATRATRRLQRFVKVSK